MIRFIFTLLILLPFNGLAQKFMVVDGDTLPFKVTPKVHTDTFRLGNTTFYPGDTSFSAPCHTFELLEGRIINRTSPYCKPVGYWIITHEDSTVSKGSYTQEGRPDGVWSTYAANGELLKEIEYTAVASGTEVLREVHYKEGQAIIIKDASWFLRFYLQHMLLIFVVLGLAFLPRIFINSAIYNSLNGTSLLPVYFRIGSLTTENFSHSVLCTFTFWWSLQRLDNENRTLAAISNMFSGVFLVLLLALILGHGFLG